MKKPINIKRTSKFYIEPKIQSQVKNLNGNIMIMIFPHINKLFPKRP